eukprot:4265435-Pyramimonas_sp.AAC.1
MQQQLYALKKKFKESAAKLQQTEGGCATHMKVDAHAGGAGCDKDPKLEIQRLTRPIETTTNGVDDEAIRPFPRGSHQRKARMAL